MIDIIKISGIEQAHKAIQLVNQLPSIPMTTEEVIERGLLFAKASPTDKEIMYSMQYFEYKTLETGMHANDIAEVLLTEFPDALHDWWADTKGRRKEFKSRLVELMRSPEQAIKRADKYLDLLRNEMLITGVIGVRGVVEHRFLPITTKAAYTYVLFALITNERWERLRQCGYSKCQTVFYRKPSKSGGRPRDYCTKECQLKADGKNALLRQKDQRRRRRQSKRGRL